MFSGRYIFKKYLIVVRGRRRLEERLRIREVFMEVRDFVRVLKYSGRKKGGCKVF